MSRVLLRPGQRRPGQLSPVLLSPVLRAEWTKLRTVSGPAWLLAAVAVLTIAISLAAEAATRCPARVTCPVDPVKLSLTGVQLGQAIVAILAVLAVGNEYSTGLIRLTLAAMPRRTQVLGAKAAIVTVLVLAVAVVAVAGSVLAGHLILPGHGFTAARGFPVPSLSRRAVASGGHRGRALPGADRADGSGDHGDPARQRRRDRDRARGALPDPDHRRVRQQPATGTTGSKGTPQPTLARRSSRRPG